MGFFPSTKLPPYLQAYHIAVSSEEAYLTRSTKQNKIKPIPARTKVFDNSFFPSILRDSKLNDKIRIIESINDLKYHFLTLLGLRNFVFGKSG